MVSKRIKRALMSRRLLVGVALSFSVVAGASAQTGSEPLRLEGLVPSGGRSTVTEGWSTLRFTIENRGPSARDARVVVFFPDRRDVQFGRDVWVPARSRITSWLPIGPAPHHASELRRDFSYMFFDRTGGVLRPLSPTEPELIPSRPVPYGKREPTTAILVEAVAGEPDDPDPLASPNSPAAQSVVLARTFRHARGLSEKVSLILDRTTPTPKRSMGRPFGPRRKPPRGGPGRTASHSTLVASGGTLVVARSRRTGRLAPSWVMINDFRSSTGRLTTLRLRGVMDDPASVTPRVRLSSRLVRGAFRFRDAPV